MKKKSAETVASLQALGEQTLLEQTNLRVDFSFKHTDVWVVDYIPVLHKPFLSFVFWHEGSTFWKQLKRAFEMQVNNREWQIME